MITHDPRSSTPLSFDFFVATTDYDGDDPRLGREGLLLIEGSSFIVNKALRGDTMSEIDPDGGAHWTIVEKGYGWYSFAVVDKTEFWSSDVDDDLALSIKYDDGDAAYPIADVPVRLRLDPARDVEGRLTATRAGYLDNLNVGGLVASSAEATSIQNNTRVVRVVPETIHIPESSTRTYRIELLLYDDVGNMEAPDSAPTIALVNQAGTDRSGRLDSTTMSLVSTGRYRAVYTSTADDPAEQLVWAFSVVEGGATRIYGNNSSVEELAAGTIDANVVSIDNDAITVDSIAAAALAAIGSAVWSTTIEGSRTAADELRGILSGVMGKATGFLSGVITFMDPAGTKTRWIVTTDADGRQEVIEGDLT